MTMKVVFPFRYNIYFCGFIVCECLNLFIVLLQFAMTHRFLHYRYFLYGFNVSKFWSCLMRLI